MNIFDPYDHQCEALLDHLNKLFETRPRKTAAAVATDKQGAVR